MDDVDLVSIDLETTGLIDGYNEIISISCIAVNEKREIVTQMHAEMKPMHPQRIDDESLKINGYTKEQIMEFPPPAAARSSFMIWCEHALEGNKIRALAHNWAFDKAFIKLWLGDELFNELFHYHFEDSMVTARYLKRCGLIPKELSTSLVPMCDHFNIPFKAHRSKDDSHAANLLYNAECDLLRQLVDDC